MQPESFTAGDLRRLLERMTLVKRKALLYALDASKELEDVCAMTWAEVKHRPITSFAPWILMSMPRHVTEPHVFWEYGDEGEPGPITAASVITALHIAAPKVSLEQLRGAYQTIVWRTARPDTYELSEIIRQMSGRIVEAP